MYDVTTRDALSNGIRIAISDGLQGPCKVSRKQRGR